MQHAESACGDIAAQSKLFEFTSGFVGEPADAFWLAVAAATPPAGSDSRASSPERLVNRSGVTDRCRWRGILGRDSAPLHECDRGGGGADLWARAGGHPGGIVCDVLKLCSITSPLCFEMPWTCEIVLPVIFPTAY
jgi:hypothetical protein